MFGLSAWHLAILVVVGLFVFGPERLPTMIRDLGKALRQVRQTATSMQEDLKAELGPEVGDLDLRSLHPAHSSRSTCSATRRIPSGWTSCVRTPSR